MKTITYKTTVTQPALVIQQDQSAGSPREPNNFSNLGLLCINGTFLPNELHHDFDDDEPRPHELYESTHHIVYIMIQDSYQNSFKLIDTPDKSNGFMAIPKCYNGYDQKAWHVSKTTDNESAKQYFTTREEAIEIARQELDLYTLYLNGEVYEYTLFNQDGTIQDQCSGFYGIESIRDDLPEDWKDEDLTDYLDYNN